MSSIEVRLPQIGFTMEEGELAEWLAQDGARVEEGAPLYSLEAEKATQEIEAPASGTLRIHAPAGDSYAVGTLLAVIVS